MRLLIGPNRRAHRPVRMDLYFNTASSLGYRGSNIRHRRRVF